MSDHVRPSSDTLVKTEIRRFVVATFLFGQDDASLGDDESFLDRGIVDSTGILEIVSFLETRFHVSVANEELLPDNLDSINRVVKFVSAKLVTHEIAQPS